MIWGVLKDAVVISLGLVAAPRPRLGNAGSVYAEQERKLEELLASDAYDWV